MRITAPNEACFHETVLPTSDPALATAMLVVRGDADAREAEGRIERDARERAHVAFDRAVESMGDQANHVLAGALVSGSLALLGGASSVAGVVFASPGATASSGGAAPSSAGGSVAWSKVADAAGSSASRIGDATGRIVGDANAQRDQIDSSRERQGSDLAKSLAGAAHERSSELDRDAQSAREAADGMLQARSASLRAALGRA